MNAHQTHQVDPNPADQNPVDQDSTDTDQGCFHCGLDVPVHSNFVTEISGKPRRMCCPGCQAVAQAIADGGLDNYYKHRTGEIRSPELRDQAIPEQLLAELALYNQPSIQKAFVTDSDDGTKHAALVIEGITCAACVWLLEHHIANFEGVNKISVNLTNHRASLNWDNDVIQLSDILSEIYRIGYQGHPYHPDKEEQMLATETRKATRRLGIAGVFCMQVMMLAVALYAGDTQGLEDHLVTFIRWASFALATPVVIYSARPFFEAAIRDIKTRHLTMDVPVSIAIGGAYLSSIWATITASGEVYYDSVTMFTFFLLIGRFLEMKARHRTGRAGNSLLNLLPASAIIISNGEEQMIPATDLNAGDRVLVKPGHTVPADGVILVGQSSIDESALTGEYLPVSKSAGDPIVGGTINVENPIQIEITQVGASTQLSAIVRLLERAHEEKPPVARAADKLAGYFVAAVLITALTVGITWWFIAPEHAFWITLSVLVVTCPCALSLATPTALTVATGTLRQNGLLVTRGHVLESLSRATHIIFDKTGTLTEGNLSLQQVVVLEDQDREQALTIACALEAHSEHPIAKAFHKQAQYLPAIKSAEITNHVGQGLEGCIDSKRYYLGKPRFASQHSNRVLDYCDAPDNHSQWLLLSSETGPIAWFGLTDPPRKQSQTTLAQLKAAGLQIEMLTGDSSAAVQQVASELGINKVIAGVTPEQKLQHIQQLQDSGARVIMVGDGINDIPVLAGAQTSIAMGSATDLAKTNADAVLISGELQRLPQALYLGRKTQAIIRQNLSWAIIYNLIALPLAATGMIAPYMAAIGMSASSLVVVGNALRLSKLSRINRVELPDTSIQTTES
ncbi:heavy metal translocating P-type ATPase [Amphritea balenae]|uniref:Heavy metal translocating P-type ATPase n=1 Tax=Amphritea balenae TaxID=452629 RepID=A0A3P1SLK0_9GAMM|nr:heavy metal translocating P-type ATPase [Amphritea balenae]RRC97804.1 heavy metal translocating P-type ATPase [Amphritea balenae]GGK83128.1 cation-transporting P-type ATPase [Amphritea balenae]